MSSILHHIGSYLPSRNQAQAAAGLINNISGFSALGAALAMAIPLVPILACITPAYCTPVALYIGTYKEEIKVYMQHPTVRKAGVLFIKFEKTMAVSLAAAAGVYGLSGVIWHECERNREQKSFYDYYSNVYANLGKKNKP